MVCHVSHATAAAFSSFPGAGWLLLALAATVLAWLMRSCAVARRELRRRNGQLETALAAAREATELKSQFLANMSHEIRTPIHGALGMTELLLCTQLDDEQREYADAVRRSAQSLLAVINDILDISKIEAGKLELESVVFDVWCAVEEAAALMAFRAYSKSLELVCAIDPAVPRLVRGDPSRLRQVLTNLLGNAVKFTERGHVTIAVERAGEEPSGTCRLRFTVTDTGAGIPPEQRSRLFQNFVQGDPGMARRCGGSGLGLAISRRLVEAMGGGIDFDSEPGKGTRFWFTTLFGCEAGESAGAGDAQLSGVRVLVVDDKPASRMAVTRYLQSWGCRTEESGSSADALDRILAACETDPFRAVVVDLHMPDRDGRWLAEHVRSDSRLDGMRLLALTPIGVVGESKRLKGCGFDAHMPKPVRPSQLYGRLLELLGPLPDVRPGPPRTESAMGGRRVLVAEDHDINQKIVLRMLEKAGCQADRVANGREAVEAVLQNAYDFVLMDVQMPEMDGFAATKEIRSRERGRHTRIAAMTANAMTGDRERCLAAGMDDYISKPVRLVDLERIVSRWIG